MLPEPQAHECFVRDARRRQCGARTHRDLLAVTIDCVAGIDDDAAALGRWFDVNAKSAHDPEAMQHAVVTPEFFAVIVLLVLQRGGIQQLPGKEVWALQSRACRGAGITQCEQRRGRPQGRGTAPFWNVVGAVEQIFGEEREEL